MSHTINKFFVQIFRLVIFYICLQVYIPHTISFASCKRAFQETGTKRSNGNLPLRTPDMVIIDRLFQDIREKKDVLLRDFHVIGEEGFNVRKSHSLFVQKKPSIRVINSYYYNQLVKILYPIFQSNKKGLILTTNIHETNRLTEFLNKSIEGITFEAYHSEVSDRQKKTILDHSRATNSHYIITTRVFSKKLDLHELSAYIDLNFSVELRDRLKRVNRVLNLFTGEKNYDVLMLIDYFHERNTKNLLRLLETVDILKIDESAEFLMEQNNNFLLKNGKGMTPLKRTDLYGLRTSLKKLIGNLSELREKMNKERTGQPKRKWLSYKKAAALVRRKRIRTRNEFRIRRQYDLQLQQIPYYPDREYKNKGWINWSAFLGTGRFSTELGLSYKEAEGLVQRKGIKTLDELKQRRETDPELQQVPVEPRITYKDKGWINRYYFFHSLFDILQRQEKEKEGQIELPYFMGTESNEKPMIENSSHY